jgi:hypothetical protein
LEQGRGALSITYRCGQYAPIAEQRLQSVKNLVEARWRDAGHEGELVVHTKVECGP